MPLDLANWKSRWQANSVYAAPIPARPIGDDALWSLQVNETVLVRSTLLLSELIRALAATELSRDPNIAVCQYAARFVVGGKS